MDFLSLNLQNHCFEYQTLFGFLISQVQLGEEMLASGEIDGGIEHLANAVAVCGQPAQLLTVLQKTLPPPIFQILVQRLPLISQVSNLTSGLSKQVFPYEKEDAIPFVSLVFFQRVVVQPQMAEEDVE